MVGGDSALVEVVGLNTGAEGLSLVLGGENSGVVGLNDESIVVVVVIVAV